MIATLAAKLPYNHHHHLHHRRWRRLCFLPFVCLLLAKSKIFQVYWFVDFVILLGSRSSRRKKISKKKLLRFFFFLPLLSVFPSICLSVPLSVCPSVRSSAPLIQWRFRWNFVGRFIPWPIVCKWEPLLWTPPLPSNGTLKFLKNHKKIIFSKINRARAAVHSAILSKISSRILWKLSEKIDFEWTLVENNKKNEVRYISETMSQIYMKLVW